MTSKLNLNGKSSPSNGDNKSTIKIPEKFINAYSN